MFRKIYLITRFWDDIYPEGKNPRSEKSATRSLRSVIPNGALRVWPLQGDGRAVRNPRRAHSDLSFRTERFGSGSYRVTLRSEKFATHNHKSFRCQNSFGGQLANNSKLKNFHSELNVSTRTSFFYILHSNGALRV